MFEHRSNANLLNYTPVLAAARDSNVDRCVFEAAHLTSCKFGHLRPNLVCIGRSFSPMSPHD